MALDTQAKRMAVSGAGRPTMRARQPAANSAAARAAAGNGYLPSGGAAPPAVGGTRVRTGRHRARSTLWLLLTFLPLGGLTFVYLGHR